MYTFIASLCALIFRHQTPGIDKDRPEEEVQGVRRWTVLQAGAIASALVGYYLKPVVKVLKLGVYGPHRAYFSAEATRDAVVLADVHLHSIPVRFNLPAPDPGN